MNDQFGSERIRGLGWMLGVVGVVGMLLVGITALYELGLLP